MLEGVTEEQVRCLLKNWKVGVARLNSEFRFQMVNAEIERIDGRTAEELQGRLIWEAWPNTVGSDVEKLVRLAMETRKGGTAPLYRTTRPGRTIFLEVRVQPWGEGVALFVLDVSSWVHLESEKEAIEQRYKLASRASQEVQYEWDIENDVWRSNGGQEKIFGEGVGRVAKMGDLTALIHPEDLENIRNNFRKTLSNGGSNWEVEYRVQRGDGWASVHDRGFVLYDNEGKPVRAVGVMKDISENERSQTEIKRLQSELIHVSRVSAMGTMASVLAHELNQPLAAIGSYLAGAERLLENADELDRDLLLQAVKSAHEGSARAGKIIQRLRAMTKKADHQREPTNIGLALDNAISLALIGRTHLRSTLSIEVPKNLEIQADAIQLEQVLLNLIRNAFEANEAAGTEGVEIAARELADDNIGITISDSGSGIPRDLHAKLFDFFVSTKEDGMGIGLPISRTIVEAHGGKISVENRKPKGSTFRIVLPIDGH